MHVEEGNQIPFIRAEVIVIQVLDHRCDLYVKLLRALLRLSHADIGYIDACYLPALLPDKDGIAAFPHSEIDCSPWRPALNCLNQQAAWLTDELRRRVAELAIPEILVAWIDRLGLAAGDDGQEDEN